MEEGELKNQGDSQQDEDRFDIFGSLSYDIIVEVLSFAQPYHKIFDLPLVCKKWHSIFDDQEFWKRLCNNCFPWFRDEIMNLTQKKEDVSKKKRKKKVQSANPDVIETQAIDTIKVDWKKTFFYYTEKSMIHLYRKRMKSYHHIRCVIYSPSLNIEDPLINMLMPHEVIEKDNHPVGRHIKSYIVWKILPLYLYNYLIKNKLVDKENIKMHDSFDCRNLENKKRVLIVYHPHALCRLKVMTAATFEIFMKQVRKAVVAAHDIQSIFSEDGTQITSLDQIQDGQVLIANWKNEFPTLTQKEIALKESKLYLL